MYAVSVYTATLALVGSEVIPCLIGASPGLRAEIALPQPVKV
jgi:hypothetical protein